jgi:hypothetical protein
MCSFEKHLTLYSTQWVIQDEVEVESNKKNHRFRIMRKLICEDAKYRTLAYSVNIPFVKYTKTQKWFMMRIITAAGTTFTELWISPSTSNLLSGTFTIPTFGSTNYDRQKSRQKLASISDRNTD